MKKTDYSQNQNLVTAEKIQQKGKIKKPQTKVIPVEINNTNSDSGLKLGIISMPIYDFSLHKTGKITLNSDIWKVELNSALIHQVVVAQQSSWRLGTKKVKNRAEVSGGGRKPWRQKGTGRARHGSIRSPIWRGGGVTFGPTGQENYLKKTNQKVFRKVICMLLSDFYHKNNLLLWFDKDFTKPSTKQMIELLLKLSLQGKKVLMIIDQKHFNLVLSARNLLNVKTVFADNLSAYDLLNNDKLVLYSQAVPLIEKRLGY